MKNLTEKLTTPRELAVIVGENENDASANQLSAHQFLHLYHMKVSVVCISEDISWNFQTNLIFPPCFSLKDGRNVDGLSFKMCNATSQI